MLSIAKMAPDAEDYYLAAGPRDGCAEDYYLGKSEAAGRWAGGGSAALGLTGAVSVGGLTAAMREFGPEGAKEDIGPLTAVLRGLDPLTGEKLAAPTGRPITVPGFDGTLSAPKSVSVLYALGGPELQLLMRDAHDRAVDTTIGYLEDTAAFSRRGGMGRRVASSGFVAAVFRHRTSRSADPQLHSHVVIANRVQRADGTWTAFDGGLLYKQKMAAGAVYRAQLRENLAPLGLRWTMQANGLAEIAGVPRRVLDLFSKRRRQITTEMARRGTQGAVAAEAAALSTRARKGTGPDVMLEVRWAQEADGVGYGSAQITALLDAGVQRGPLDRLEARREAVGVLLSPAGLTSRASSFDERDVIRALNVALPGGASAGELLGLTRALLDTHPEVVRLPGVGPAGLRSEGAAGGAGRSLATGMAAARYSTREMMALEEQLMAAAVGAQRTGVAVVTGDVGRFIAAGRGGLGLSQEQARMVWALTLDGNGVDVVCSVAGSGKTSGLGAAVAAWRSQRTPVIGTALSASAAGQLRDDTGLRTFTTTQLLAGFDERPGDLLEQGSVIVVDEAGQVGSRALARIWAELDKVNGKLVLVGDDRQLPEIDAGGAFHGLADRLRASRLTTNHRQVDQDTADQLLELRSGPEPAAAFKAWDRDGLVTRASDSADLVTRMAVEWSFPWLQAEAGRDVTQEQARAGVVMLAQTNRQCAELNAQARVILDSAGVLSGPELLTEFAGFRAGDHVVTRLNWHRPGQERIRNGDRWTVAAVDLAAGTVQLEQVTRPGAAPSRWSVPASYVDEHLQHAYAMTISLSQGSTVRQAFVYGDGDSAYRESLYVAASRAQTTTHWYVVAAEGEHTGCSQSHGGHVHLVEDIDPFVALQQAAGRSRAQTMAIDTISPPDLDVGIA